MARTRSASAHKKVLDAALDLVAARGIEATSMDAIAQASGVSKATIYKHWADKETLLLEMLATASGLDSRPIFDTGDTRRDLVDVLSYRPPENPTVRDKIVPHLIAYSATNTAFGLSWRTKVMEPPRREISHLLNQGIAKGELVPGLNIDLALSLLLGPMLYRHIFLNKRAEDARDLASGVVDAFWRAFAR